MRLTQFEVKGLRQLERNLQALDVDLQQKAITSALKAAGKTLIAAAKINASRTKHANSGALAESVAARVKKKTRMYPQTDILIGPMAKNKRAVAQYNSFYGRNRKGIFHGHLMEAGFKAPGGRMVRGSRWLRSAFYATARGIPASFGRILKKRIESRLRRMKRQ